MIEARVGNVHTAGNHSHVMLAIFGGALGLSLKRNGCERADLKPSPYTDVVS